MTTILRNNQSMNRTSFNLASHYEGSLSFSTIRSKGIPRTNDARHSTCRSVSKDRYKEHMFHNPIQPISFKANTIIKKEEENQLRSKAIQKGFSSSNVKDLLHMTNDGIDRNSFKVTSSSFAMSNDVISDRRSHSLMKYSHVYDSKRCYFLN